MDDQGSSTPAFWHDPFTDEARREAARQLVWRSGLIMPVNVRRFVERAQSRGADAIILDLEDSIPASEKDAARASLPDVINLCQGGPADVLVRVNKPYRLARVDIDAAVQPGVAAIVVTKVESAAEVQLVDEWITQRETARGVAPGAIRIAVLVETVRGLGAAFEIAQASPRLASLSLGCDDYALDLEISPTTAGHEFDIPNEIVVRAARLAGILPLGLATSLADYSNLDAFRASVARAHQMGFVGAHCIHPGQVPILNEGFSPSETDLARAEQVIAVAREAEIAGRGSATVDGRMIDAPIIIRAQRLLARAEAIRQHAKRVISDR